MKLFVEVEVAGEPEARTLPGDGAALVAFMSFCVVRGFGAIHPLLALADLLARDHGVRLGPLTVFYERTIEDHEDREKLEAAWQEPVALRDTLAQVVALLDGDESRILVRRAGAGDLASQAEAVREIAAEAAVRGARIRLSYTL